jgi:hypothetical protein
MNKKNKKLALNTETIRKLEDADLQIVNGGRLCSTTAPTQKCTGKPI